MVKISVYSTPTCPFCMMTKEFLKGKGIEFQDIDVSGNREAAIELFNKLGYMS